MADRGIGVAFHFHPMVYYDSWREDYGSLATAVTEGFLPEEVLFLSMGSLTFIKPVIKAIRGRGRSAGRAGWGAPRMGGVGRARGTS